ncbi:MAG TPA: ABC transporter permease subunit [Fimbriimonadaceae bacterium]|nr:ABC transporter permease subunit [Fimbriimonadaceae bacterium]
MAASPIADLSYRNYDGPLDPPLYRWWAIARVAIRDAFRKKSFWVLTVLSGAWYLILMIIFYFVDSFATTMMANRGRQILDPTQAAAAMFKQVKWDEQFLHAFSMGQLMFFIIALLIGVGSVANDNRANALLVYLSKPCTKLDYVIGKWVGIFVPMAVAVAVPTLFFYGYCFMSYREYGFLNDPWLILKLPILIVIPAVFHASVALGISSMFRQGRTAGATYAGFYFFTLFFTKAMATVHFILQQEGTSTKLIDNLFYFSVDGVQIGLAKVLLHSSGGQIFPFAGPGMNMEKFAVPEPNGLLMACGYLLICGAFVLLASTRIRAVEVVS